MKQLLLAILFLLLSGPMNSQTPKPVERIVQVQHSNEFYIEQAALWKNVIEVDTLREDAWMNYYLANRYMRVEGKNPPLNYNTDRTGRLKKILADAKIAIPGTYTYDVITLFHIHDLKQEKVILDRIENSTRFDPIMFHDYVTYYETIGDYNSASKYYKKLYESKITSEGLLNFNYNILMSVAENGILLTAGDNDTYPPRMLQEALGVKQSIPILNIYLARDPVYLKNWIKRHDINLNLSKLQSTKEDFLKTLTIQLSEENKNKSVHFAITVHSSHYKYFSDSLYCIGLGYLYSTTEIDNLSLIKNNVEDRFRLDYLSHSFYDENNPKNGIVDLLNYNYVTPFALLYKHHKSVGESKKAEFYKNYVLQCARRIGKEQQMLDYLKE